MSTVMNMIGRWVAGGVSLRETPVLERLVFDRFSSLPQRFVLGAGPTEFDPAWRNSRVMLLPDQNTVPLAQNDGTERLETVPSTEVAYESPEPGERRTQ